MPPLNPPLFTRRRALTTLAAGMTGAAGCFTDAFLVEPALLWLTRREIPCANLPPALGGLRIALMADFHFRPGPSDALLEKILATIRREKPDMICLCGDFMDHDPRVIAPLVERLREMHAPHGIFAVMGNHDGWAGNATTIRRQFESAGISFLVNQHSLLAVHGEELAVAGTDFVWLGKPDPARALRGVPAATPVIALVHEPDYFDEMRKHREIMLQLSGHTHGGQCRVPWVAAAPVTPKFGHKYVHGAFSAGASSLFVTRGIGTTGVHARFSCPPELALLTLRRA